MKYLVLVVLIAAFGIASPAGAAPLGEVMQRLGSSTNGLLDKLVEIDGNFAVVGEPGVNGARGMARVYRRSTAGVWTHQFTLTANDGEAGDKFGFSVAIDGLPITVAHHRCPSRSP